MKRNHLLFVFLLLLTGLGGWVLWPGSNPEFEDPARTASDGVQIEEENGGPLSVRSAPELQPGLSERVARSDLILPQPTGPGTHPFLIVRNDNGDPVPDADVFVLERERLESPGMQRGRSTGRRDRIEQLIVSGRHFRSDAQGELRIAHGSTPLSVYARSEGIARLDLHLVPTSPGQVELGPEVWLTIQVKNVRGALVKDALVGLGPMPDGHLDGQWLRRTDQAGRAVFREVPEVMTLLGMSQDETVLGVRLLEARAHGEGETLQRPVSEALMKPDSVEFVMPLTGSLAIQLHEANNLPFSGDALLTLWEKENDADSHEPQPVSYTHIGEGPILVDHVGLGVEIAGVLDLGSSAVPIQFEVTGPQLPGDRVILDLDYRSLPALTGTLKDPEGGPLSSKMVFATLELGGAQGWAPMVSTLRTDPAGRFVLQLEADESPPLARPVELRVTYQNEEGRRWSARSSIPPKLAPENTDLGTLEWRSPPILVSGTLIGIEGLSLTETQFEIEYESRYGSKQQESHWTQVWNLKSHVNADGTFRIYGSATKRNCRMVVRAKHYHPATLDFVKGKTGLKIQLQPYSVLRGKILVDREAWTADTDFFSDEDSFLSGTLEVDGKTIPLQLREEEYGYSLSMSTTPFESGALHLWTRAGELALQLHGLRLTEGEVLAPPTLNPLDLTESLRKFSVRAFDVDGSQVYCSVGMFAESQAEWFWFSGDQPSVPSLSSSISVVVKSPNSRSKEMDLVNRVTDVVLDPGIPIRLRLPNSVVLPEGVEWVAVLEPMEYVQRDQFESVVFYPQFMATERNFCDQSLPKGGQYKIVSFGLGSSDGSYDDFPMEQSIVVEDHSELQTFPLEITQEQVDAVLEQLDR